jgi:hypothetical protein
LQPHHLAANFMMILSGFVTLCEGYLGCRPSLPLWKRLFNLRAHNARTGVKTVHSDTGKTSFETVMTDCGSCIVSGSKHGYKSPDIIQSCKDWQTSFFYVRSPDNGPDMLNLPEFRLDRPLEKYQWACKIGVGDQDVDSQVARVAKLFADGLQPYDLVAPWFDVRVLPLQRRVHRICDMSGGRDPTRICTKKMSPEELVIRVKALTSSKLPKPFRFGMTYLRRGVQPPEVRSDCFLFNRLLFLPIALSLTSYISSFSIITSSNPT